MNPQTKLADLSAVSAWGFWGVSLTQINELLQTVTLVLTIAATVITIAVHIRNWHKKRKNGTGNP